MKKLANIFGYILLLSIVVFSSCSDDDDDGAPPPTGEDNVRLLKVDAVNDEIELRNFGDAAVDISQYWICNRRNYSPISSLAGSADLNLGPGETVTLSRALDDASSDVGFYLNNTDFGDAANLIDFMQYGEDVGTAGRVDVAVAKGIWTAGEFVEGVSPFDYTGNGDQNGASAWTGTQGGGTANVRIFKVDASADRFYLKNFGDAAADLTNYWICNLKSYAVLSSLTTDAPDLTLDPDEMIGFERALDDNASDVGFYLNNNDFSDAATMIDFMQYGAAVGASGRVDVAEAKGIWTTGDFVAGVSPFDYTGNGEENGVSFWTGAAGMANVRIFKVDAATDKFYLKNFGNAATDLTDYWICNLKTYAQLNTLTTDATDLTLDPDEMIGFERALDDAASDVGVYLNNTNFGDAANIIDFMQYGAAVGAAGRVDVAVTKGIWTAGEFVDGASPYDYTGNGDENGASFWTGTAAMANVRIFKVDAVGDKFYLKNFGNVAIDVTDYWICNLLSYAQLSTLTTDAPDLTLDPDEMISFERVLDDNASDVGFYLNNNNFGDDANMIDFMQYGAAVGASGRVSVAAAKGIWTAGEFVANPGPFDYTGDGSTNGASVWTGN